MFESISQTNYNQYITISNVQDIEEAKVIFLLAHNRFSSDFSYNQEVIRKYYIKDRDLILIEDSASASIDILDTRQISSLTFSNYRIEGWDVPEICERTKKICQVLKKVNNAVAKLFEGNLDEVERNKYYNYLQNFNGYLKTINLEIHAEEEGFFNFLKRCSQATEKVRDAYVACFFEKRQQALLTKIETVLSKGEVDKIFVCASLNFIDPQEQELKRFAEHLIQSLSTPFVAINPSIRRNLPDPLLMPVPEKRLDHTG